MSGSSEKPWSGNSNAPQIPYGLYVHEKVYFTGDIIGAISYGMVVVLFFRCMNALFDPINGMGRGTKFLVAHTVAMFAFVTVDTALSLDLQTISYIDNREFAGIDGELPPGPYGYKTFAYPGAINIISDSMPLLNQWLADGLLLYRCYAIYGMNLWVITLPCLMYFATVGMGIFIIYANSQPDYKAAVDSTLSYFSLSVSLNVLLTLVIVIKLIVHSRNLKKATKTSLGANGLYRTLITMITESFALYAVIYLIYIASWKSHYASDIIAPILTMTQVIAPFLITLRVANRSALTDGVVASRNLGSDMRFGSGGVSEATLSVGSPVNSARANEGIPVDLGVWIGNGPRSSIIVEPKRSSRI